MASEFKEVVMNADSLYAEKVFPHAGNLFFKLVAWGNMSCLKIWARVCRTRLLCLHGLIKNL